MRACAELSESSDWYISVLSDKFIQRWCIESNFSETFLLEDQHIIQKIKDTFHNQVWPTRDVNEIEVFLLDIQPLNGGIILLASAINLAHSPQIHFALITLTDQNSSFVIKGFHQFKTNAFYSGDANDENLKYKLIITQGSAYVYGDRIIYEVLLNGKFGLISDSFSIRQLVLILTNIFEYFYIDIGQTGEDNTEKIEFNTQGDKILAAAVYNQIPLFFTRLNGLVSISSSDFDAGDFFNR